MSKKVSLVLEGGGMRGAYTAGCLSWLIDEGIEFDYVIIPFVDEVNYHSPLDRNMLYVASTRALHELDILYEGKKSKFLKRHEYTKND